MARELGGRSALDPWKNFYPKQVSAYGTRSWVLSRPYGTGLQGRQQHSRAGLFQPSLRDSHLKRRVLTQTLKLSAELGSKHGNPLYDLSRACASNILEGGERRRVEQRKSR